MNRSPSPISRRAIAWALLSQSIWLPLVAIDAHDHWQARVKALTPPTDPTTASSPKPSPLPPTRLAATRPLPSLEEDALGIGQAPPDRPRQGATRTGLLLGGSPSVPQLSLPKPWLGTIRRAVENPLQAVIAIARPARWIPTVAPVQSPVMTRATAEPAARWQGPPIPSPGGDVLLRTFTRSELLGGTLGLKDIDDAPMSAVALAERARWAGSVDPMAPLPALWRDPMRRALGQIPGGGARIEQARVVHVPSRRVMRTTEVPLALQSDGSVDILSKPDDPGVVREIADWSSRQQAPSRGGMLPAVVLLHPVSDVPPIAPAETLPNKPRSESPAVVPPSASSRAARPTAPQAQPVSWDEVVPTTPSDAPQPQAVEAAPEPVVAEVAAPAPEPPPMAEDPQPAPVPAASSVPTP
ncbi:hypothetical protein NZK32_00490 [Cyanobium sp. FGCU-52]|nr:hypothetical protein [Cyanobium sp. FGCU52]